MPSLGSRSRDPASIRSMHGTSAPGKEESMTLDDLNQLVGSWALESTHPAFPGLVVRGTAEIGWLEGNRFLMHRARVDHPDFPDSLSIVGDMGSDRVDEDPAEPPPPA